MENTSPVPKKGRKKGNYRPVSFKSVPGKIIEQILLEDMLGQMRDEDVIQGSHSLSWHIVSDQMDGLF